MLESRTKAMKERLDNCINHSPNRKLFSLWMLTTLYLYIAIVLPLVFPWDAIQSGAEVERLLALTGAMMATVITVVFGFMGMKGVFRSLRLGISLDKIERKH